MSVGGSGSGGTRLDGSSGAVQSFQLLLLVVVVGVVVELLAP